MNFDREAIRIAETVIGMVSEINENVSDLLQAYLKEELEKAYTEGVRYGQT